MLFLRCKTYTGHRDETFEKSREEVERFYTYLSTMCIYNNLLAYIKARAHLTL